jgi:hypothetical protein
MMGVKSMTLPTPDKKWDGFRLTEYYLDHKKVFALQLTEKRTENGEASDFATTVGDVYQRLSGRECKADPRTPVNTEKRTENGNVHIQRDIGVVIATDTEKLVFTGPPFNGDLLATMLDLRRRGIEALLCHWFYYDEDWYAKAGAEEIYRFFIVDDDKIVAEDVHFSVVVGSWWGFDPDVFCEADSVGADWSSQAASREAETHYWYRRFYTETKTGQIMTLRRDHPRLYGQLPEPEPKPDVAVILLKKIHALLWALVVIGGLLLIRFWR